MRRLATFLLLFSGACSEPSLTPAAEPVGEQRALVRVAPVGDLQFSDYQLQVIALDLIREARLRGIDEIAGANRIERLLLLEATLGRSQHALDRVNELTRHLTAGDASRWARLRQRAESELANHDDRASRAARDMLARWQREKADIAFRYLSSNYRRFISTSEWERRFHEYVAARPADVAAWAWLLAREEAPTPHLRHERVELETAYRQYLEESRAANPRTTRLVFAGAH